MATKRGDEVEAGDLLRFLSSEHRIVRIDPPEPATLAIMPGCVGYAKAADGWGITLDRAGSYEVA